MGPFAPAICVALFLLANLLIVWRLEALSERGVEGTVLGTIFMPFCSGMGNLVFAVSLALNRGEGHDLLVNALFNNATNLTLLLGLPALIWGMASLPRKKSKAAMREFRVGRLAISLNLMAAFFFSLFVWLLAADGELGRTDGGMLVALFVFWQLFHLYDVKKTNLLKSKSYPKTLPFEAVLLLLGAVAVFVSADWLVWWFGVSPVTRDFPPGALGLAGGVLMVLPNALLAFYYGARDRMDVVYTSQSGDAHVCIPLSIGLFALIRPIAAGAFLQRSLTLLMALCAVHLFFVAAFGRLPRVFAGGIAGAFFVFLWLLS